MDSAAASQYPLLDAANAEAIYTFVSNGEVTQAQAPQLLSEVTSQIEAVFADDVFTGSIEDSASLTFYLLSRELLRRTLGEKPDSADFYRIAAIGTALDQPRLITIAYSSIAEDLILTGDYRNAVLFIAKIRSSAIAAPSRRSLTIAPEHSPDLRARLVAAKSVDLSSRADEVHAINQAAQRLDYDEGNLRIVLDSAVAFFDVSEDSVARDLVARTTHHYLKGARQGAAYKTLPRTLLARFYEDAATNLSEWSTVLEALELSADFYAEAHQPREEINMLLARVKEYIRLGHMEEAHDLLGSYFVKAIRSGELAARAHWTAYFSETLRVISRNMAMSTQVLLDFMATNPASAATESREYSAIGNVAELLGDRYAAVRDDKNSRRNYGIAFELFSSAGDMAALNALRTKA